MIPMERDPLDQAAHWELPRRCVLERPHHRPPGASAHLAPDVEHDPPVAVKVLARAPDQGATGGETVPPRVARGAVVRGTDSVRTERVP